MKYLILLLLITCHCTFVKSQKAVFNEIAEMKASGLRSQPYKLLKFESTNVQNRDYQLAGLNKGTIMSFDRKTVQSLFTNDNDFITIPLQITERSSIILMLKRHEIFSPDFRLVTSADQGKVIDYVPGLHYIGIVEGDPSSIVALSVFNDQIIALIATDQGNFTIGPVKGDTESRHIFYNDRDLEKAFDFECGTLDDGLGYTKAQLKPLQNSRDVGDCVRLYIEIDHNIVIDKGGAVNATNFVTAMFNQSFLIYANESINMVISEIKAWTTTSPYSGSTQSQMLSSYQQNTEFFNGDISQLVTYSAVGGSAAGTNGLCNANPDLSKCYSHIDTSFSNFPIYSWTVFVITHENGHLLGSSHTHSCVWNGNNTAIDGCYTPAGSCPMPPIPPNGGTIMSYCYLASSGSFVDFNLGFGPQPGNRIRNSVNASANCLTPCGNPTNYCASNGANSSTEFIDKIVSGTINNLSGNNGGYGDYTSLSTNFNAGNTYTISLTPKFTGGNKIKYWRVWIDYNKDFDWYDNGELVGQGSGSNAINLTFTIPANNTSINTRMRIGMQYQSYPSFCGTFPIGEVEDYTVNIIAASATCSDGIQNQGETGIDCGGPCPACPPAPTCTDGIQNQGETGIDCGGPCIPCAGGNMILLASYFETGWDSWIDGGSDVTRVNSANSYEGLYSIRLADNSGVQSAMTSPTFNLSNATGLEISFHYYAASMEAGEDFWVMYNSGSTWVTIAAYVSGTNFNNNSFYSVTVTVPNFVPTATGSLRIQCDAGDNSDQVYIDQVIITKLTGGPIAPSVSEIHNYSVPVVQYRSVGSSDDNKKLTVYPNPANELLNLNFNGEINDVRIVDVEGRRIQIPWARNTNQVVDISTLSPGIHFIWVESGGQWYPAKFSKM